MTVVVITHEAEIAAFAQRVLYFRDGRLIEDRPTAVVGAATAITSSKVHQEHHEAQ
jgi:ABC-type lipoprotein export system ATPase subunit